MKLKLTTEYKVTQPLRALIRATLHPSGIGAVVVYNERFTYNDSFIGQTLDYKDFSYTVLEVIAGGGSALVFLVVNNYDKQLYALKRLIIPDETTLRIVKKEIKYMKLCRKHQGIVKYIDAKLLSSSKDLHGSSEAHLILEFCPGRLFDLLKETKVGFSPSLVLHLFRQIVEAVEFLHSQRPPIIHRDLKIENLLIKKDGRIALCDFGSATSQVLFPNKISEVKRAEEEIQKYTTPQYRSPEMWDLLGGNSVDYKSDLWALGCILYKLCYVNSPFGDGQKLSVLNAKLSLPKDGRAHVIFHDLIAKLLSKEPDRRPDCPAILAELLTIKETVGEPTKEELASLIPASVDMRVRSKLALFQRKCSSKVLSAYHTLKDYALQIKASQAVTDPILTPHELIPRMLVAVACTGSKFGALCAALRNNYKQKSCFHVNVGAPLAETNFGVFVRDVKLSLEGSLGLSELYEICGCLDAWLLSEKSNIVFLYCHESTLDQCFLLASSYLLYCGLCADPSIALKLVSSKLSRHIHIKPSLVRKLSYVKAIRTTGLPAHRSFILVTRLSYTLINELRRFSSYIYFLLVMPDFLYSTESIPFTVKNNEVHFSCAFEVTGDFLIRLVMTHNERRRTLLEFYAHSDFVREGNHQFIADAMDKLPLYIPDTFYITAQFTSPTAEMSSAHHADTNCAANAVEDRDQAVCTDLLGFNDLLNKDLGVIGVSDLKEASMLNGPELESFFVSDNSVVSSIPPAEDATLSSVNHATAFFLDETLSTLQYLSIFEEFTEVENASLPPSLTEYPFYKPQVERQTDRSLCEPIFNKGSLTVAPEGFSKNGHMNPLTDFLCESKRPPKPRSPLSPRDQKASPASYAKVDKDLPGNLGFEELLASEGFNFKTKTKGQTLASLQKGLQNISEPDDAECLQLKIDAWVKAKGYNIRSMLVSLQEVLWEECDWRVTMADVLEASGVKRAYRKACLLCHPDRIEGRIHEDLARLLFQKLSQYYNAWMEAGSPGSTY
ncbi:uncharacterized protein LOC135146004 isoform X2 [Zophobas morio]|uniref:uncharacterized protein LOC135146004 isoform X2 n=1 Tax=Zophobas morio TaxID=2755281 RepID=UPI003082EA66